MKTSYRQTTIQSYYFSNMSDEEEEEEDAIVLIQKKRRPVATVPVEENATVQRSSEQDKNKRIRMIGGNEMNRKLMTYSFSFQIVPISKKN